MKLFKTATIGLGLLVSIGSANASLMTTVDITYTVDNRLNTLDIGLINLGTSAVTYFGNAGSDSDWRTPTSLSFDLEGGMYEIVFSVENFGLDGDPNNPAGLLAEINTGTTTLTTDSSWLVANYHPNPAAVTYSGATSYGVNGGSNIWTNVNGGSPITGISTDAQWIWDSTNTDKEYLYIKSATFQVPEPSIVALFGLGLVAIGFSARRRKS